MGNILNVGESIMIVGVLYLHLAYGLNFIVTALLVLFACCTWAYHGYQSERTRLFEAQIRLLDAKAKYWEWKREKKDR